MLFTSSYLKIFIEDTSDQDRVLPLRPLRTEWPTKYWKSTAKEKQLSALKLGFLEVWKVELSPIELVPY